MNIKTKKIKLTKILIGSSLLLSTVSLPLALTSCSKSKGVSNEDKEQQKNLTSYLFNLDNPQLLNDKDEPIENKDTLFLKDNVKNLVNDLKTKDGYNDDFLTKLDDPIEKIYQKDEKGQYFEVNDLGEIVVHYLDSSLVAGKCLSFAVNEEVFSGFDKFEDIKSNVSCSKIKLNDHLTIDSKEVKGFEIVDKQDVKFYTGFDKASNKDQFYDEKKDDAKISDIKKIKIDLNDTSSNGFLITFKPAKGEGNKTIIFKYVDDKEVEFYKEDFYKNFEENAVKQLHEIGNEYFIVANGVEFEDWKKHINKQLATIDANDKSEFEKLSFIDKSVDKSKLVLKDDIKKIDDVKDHINDFFDFLNNEKLKLGFTFDKEKSVKYNNFCLDQSSLVVEPQKAIDKFTSYLLCIKGNNTLSVNGKEISVSLKFGDKDAKYGVDTFDVVLEPQTNVDKELVIKLTSKYKEDIEFWSKDIIVKDIIFKK